MDWRSLSEYASCDIYLKLLYMYNIYNLYYIYINSLVCAEVHGLMRLINLFNEYRLIDAIYTTTELIICIVFFLSLYRWYCKNMNRSQAENLLKTEVSLEPGQS